MFIYAIDAWPWLGMLLMDLDNDTRNVVLPCLAILIHEEFLLLTAECALPNA